MSDSQDPTRVRRVAETPTAEISLGDDGDAADPLGIPSERRYEDAREIGKGGSGRVLLVTDRRISRAIALKELRPSEGASLGDASRFTREVWITGQLGHPGIVPVYDAGISQDGTHYYTMPYLRGRSLKQALGECNALDDRLALLNDFARVCQAVAFAHSRGVIHRDLKPANVIVGKFGETHVVDWGLARVGAHADADSLQGVESFGSLDETMHGAVLGTPVYMSPEQARGEATDERSDVWGLGAILHEILTGDPPVPRGEVETILQRLKRIHTEPIVVNAPGAPAELSAIASRALAATPDDRYPSARELAADLLAYLDGRRVTSYDYSAAELLVRFVRRYRVALLVALAFITTVAVMGVVSYQRTAAERDRAVKAERLATTERDRAVRAEAEATAYLSDTLAEKARAAADLDARAEAEVLAAHALRYGRSPEALGVLSQFGVSERAAIVQTWALPERCATGRLSPAGTDLICISDGAASLWPIGASQPRWRADLDATAAEFTGDGRSVVVLSAERAHILAVADGTRPCEPVDGVRELDPIWGGGMALIHHTSATLLGGDAKAVTTVRACTKEAGIDHATVSPDLAKIAVLCKSSRLFFGTPSRPQEREIVLSHGLMSLTFSPAGDRVVTGGIRGGIRLIDPDDAHVIETLREDGPLVSRMAWSPDGRLLAVVHEDQSISLWDVGRASMLGRLPARPRRLPTVVLTAEATLVTAADAVRRWRLPQPWRPDRVGTPHGLSHAAFSPDGAYLATAHGDGAVLVWDRGTGKVVADVTWQDRVAKRVAWSPDGNWLAAVAASETGARLWHVGQWDRGRVLDDGLYMRIGFVAGGSTLVALPYGPRPAISTWSIPELESGSIPGPGRELIDLYVTPRSERAVVADSDGTIWSLSEAGLDKIAAQDGLLSTAISSDGSLLAVVPRGRVVHVLALPSGEPRGSLEGHDQLVLDAAFSPDDRALAAAGLDRSVRVWDVQTGELVATLRGHRERVATVAFDVEGRALVSACWDGRARMWDLSVLRRSEADVLDEVERAWALTLKDAIAAPIR